MGFLKMRAPAILFPWQDVGRICRRRLIKFGRGNKCSAVTQQWRGREQKTVPAEASKVF
jgi:hypothetical protein